MIGNETLVAPDFKIGITNAADASTDLSIFSKLYPLLNIIITRDLRDSLFQSLLLQNASKIILHVIISGFGGTPMEPNTPSPKHMYSLIGNLIAQGFPKNRIVLRVDPVVPSPQGLQLFDLVLSIYYKLGIKRCRYSIFKLPKHIIGRASLNQVFMMFENPYYSLSENKCYYSANSKQRQQINAIIKKYEHLYVFESCDRNQFTPSEHQLGCISERDLRLSGITGIDIQPNLNADNKGCRCPVNKTELITNTQYTQCKLKCAHCFKHTSNI